MPVQNEDSLMGLLQQDALTRQELRRSQYKKLRDHPDSYGGKEVTGTTVSAQAELTFSIFWETNPENHRAQVVPFVRRWAVNHPAKMPFSVMQTRK